MRVAFHVDSGPSVGRKVHLRAGQRANFGRTEWSDYSFPEDSQLEDVHFSIDCKLRECVLRDNNTGEGTAVNGERVMQTKLDDGDLILAGGTTWAVIFESTPLVAVDAEEERDDAEDATEKEVPDDELSPPEVCEYLELDDSVIEMSEQCDTLEEVATRLRDEGQLAASIRIQAHRLPPREAVWWASQCLQKVYSDAIPAAQVDSLQAAIRWIEDPSDENREAAEQAAEANQYDGPASWIALAAFWSGGNIAPHSFEEVLPDERLCGQAVAAALSAVATFGDPALTPVRQQEFLQFSEEILQGKRTPPEPVEAEP